MTPEELEEAVALRLLSVASPHSAIYLDSAGQRLTPQLSPLYFHLARECVRLMQWARRECVGERWEGDARDGTRHLVDRSERPLTLPDPDWRPE